MAGKRPKNPTDGDDLAALDNNQWGNETTSRSAHRSRSRSRSTSRSDSNSDSDSRSCHSSGSSSGSSMSGSGSEQEDLKDYKRGGYHPLKPKCFLNNRYLIIRKLGWGHFSTVWMAFDQIDRDFKALKVVRSASTYTETARDEIELLQHAAKADPTDQARERLVHLHESFELDGPFGHHVVLVMEITGPSLFNVGRRAGSNGLKLQTVRNITKRVLEGLAYLHDKAHMIHTDLKPENISLAIGFAEKMAMAKEALRYTNEQLPMPRSMVSTYYWEKNEQSLLQENSKPTGSDVVSKDESNEAASSVVSDLLEERANGNKSATDTSTWFNCESAFDPAKDVCDPMIKIVDMGNACWTYKKFTNDIQTREYRAFEVLMGGDYSANVDIWSLGCIAFEMATGDYLFNPRHGEDFATDEDHVAQMIERLGNPSKKVSTKGKYCHKFFNRRGHFKCFDARELDPQSITQLLIDEYRWMREEAASFAQFIEACLVYDPLLRPSAAMLLEHPFFRAVLREEYVAPEKEKKDKALDNEAGDGVQSAERSIGVNKDASKSVLPGKNKHAKIESPTDDAAATEERTTIREHQMNNEHKSLATDGNSILNDLQTLNITRTHLNEDSTKVSASCQGYPDILKKNNPDDNSRRVAPFQLM